MQPSIYDKNNLYTEENIIEEEENLCLDSLKQTTNRRNMMGTTYEALFLRGNFPGSSVLKRRRRILQGNRTSFYIASQNERILMRYKGDIHRLL